MMVHSITQKVIVDGVDISRHVVSISATTMNLNSYPTAKIQVTNPIGIYTCDPDTSIMYQRSSVQIWASKDAGENYFKLLDGVVIKPGGTVSETGTSTMTLDCIGGKNLDQMALSPNSIVIPSREYINQVFIGKSTDSHGDAWTADDNGNYPDGLLFETGYTYDGVTSLFDDDWDFPSNYASNNFNIYNTIKNVCELYGLVFFIDDNNSKLIVRKAPTVEQFPTHTFVFERGRNINSVTDNSDQRRKYDKVIVIGSGVHAIVGNGIRTYTHTDSEISDYSTAVAVADTLASTLIQSSEAPAWHETSISSGPITAEIVGKSILVKDKFFSLTNTYRNCIGLAHDIKDGRWVSTASFENYTLSIGKTLAEVIEESEENNTTSGVGYINVESPEIDSSVLARYPNPAAIGVKDTDDNYIIKTLSTSFARGGDGCTYTMDTISSSEFNTRMDEILYLFNDIGVISVATLENGDGYASYSTDGTSTVTDGTSCVVMTTAGVGYMYKGITIGSIYDNTQMRFSMQSDADVTITITVYVTTTANKLSYNVNLLAGELMHFSVPIQLFEKTGTPTWATVNYLSFTALGACELKVYDSSNIYNDIQYLNILEPGNDYADYTGVGGAVVTDGGDHIIQTTSAINQYKLKPHTVTESITTGMYITFDIESNVTQTVTLVLGYYDAVLGYDRQIYTYTSLVAGVRTKINKQISNSNSVNPPFDFNNMTYMYLRQQSISVLKVYDVRIVDISGSVVNVGKTKSTENEFNVNFLPSTRTIYTG